MIEDGVFLHKCLLLLYINFLYVYRAKGNSFQQMNLRKVCIRQKHRLELVRKNAINAYKRFPYDVHTATWPEGTQDTPSPLYFLWVKCKAKEHRPSVPVCLQVKEKWSVRDSRVDASHALQVPGSLTTQCVPEDQEGSCTTLRVSSI